MLAVLLGSQSLFAAPQGQLKLTRDDVYFIIARYLVAQSESPATSIVNAIDEVIEVGEITISDKDGKATVIVKERTQSNSNSINKTIRLIFAPDGTKWKWESFENDRRLYPIERLLPYVKDEVGRRKLAAEAKWAAVLEAMTKQADAAFKALETAKAIIKSDPPPLGPVTAARTALAEARKGTEVEAIVRAHKEVTQAVEPVATLADSIQDLKANDAYLRLQEEFLNSQKSLAAARKDYLDVVAAYNEILQRIPFALAAYGLGFSKIEPQIEPE
jgi:hypothetical protein